MIYIEFLLSLNIIKSIGIVVPYLKKSIGKDSITFSDPKSYVLKSMPSLIPKSISC